ncbi:TolC family protein [Microbulbifer bruguierae]|uniref:TolC family protein n=1 Tax=Microbulbifer bruguierae TaxID=3029061 RepID=A0ABY8N953_9GAMM|nr:TolC family protein [Microbulbifer bruguierae]WGL15434.1 TolC family protein [Microbulbifer bruguierae]
MGYALRALGPLVPALLICAFALPARAQLNLESALQLAREQDPQTAAAIAAAKATAEDAVADGQWEDPRLKLGIANLPTDTFAFDDQPMTQKVIGISQKLPRGDSAGLAGARGAHVAEAGFASAGDMALLLERDVGLAFLSLSEQLRVRELLTENRRWMQELVGYNRARLASAQIQSQQLLQSQLALARLDDRIAQIDGEISRARGELSRWIGGAAWQALNPEPPAWRDTREWLSAQTLPVPLALIEQHPAVAASNARVAAERMNVALAQQAYKPQFGVDLSYGQRERTPMSDGSDFASVTVTFDLPLFRQNRQDRRLAASHARESAGMLQRQNLLQQMHAELNGAVAMAQNLDRRRREYREELLAQAEATADAVLKGYAANTADLDAVIAARMDAIEAQISAARLTYGYFRALARIRYLRALDAPSPGDAVGNFK